MALPAAGASAFVLEDVGGGTVSKGNCCPLCDSPKQRNQDHCKKHSSAPKVGKAKAGAEAPEAKNIILKMIEEFVQSQNLIFFWRVAPDVLSRSLL